MSDVQHTDFERSLHHIPKTERDSRRHSRALRDAFDKVCQDKGVYQGDGPPMAYFRTTGYCAKSFIYMSFGMSGSKPEGMAMATCTDVQEVLRASVATFTDWLKPNRTLVWRSRPEVDMSDDGTERWASYWRCVQLDDDAKQIEIVWNF
jgi:hypothetical protein